MVTGARAGTPGADPGGRAAGTVAWAWRAAPAVVVGLLVVVNAWAGLMPGVAFWDTGEFQTVLPILGTAHPTGYPTYILVGFLANLVLAPLGEPAFRITVLSLLAVAVAAGSTVVLVRRLTGHLAIGVAAGVGLALTPVVWANATRADPHPIHLALVAVLFALLVGWSTRHRAGRPGADRWLVAAAFTYALSVGNHSLSLLLAPPVGLFVLAVDPGVWRRPRLLATCAAVLVGTVVVVFAELPLRAGPFRAPLVYAHPETWDGFWYVVLAEQFRGSLHDPFGDLPAKAGFVADLAVAQFGVLAYAIPAAFIATVLRRPRYALLSGLAMAITLVFDTSYANADISRYYLGPVLWAWTWLAIAAGWLVDALGLLERPEDGPSPDGSPGGPAGARGPGARRAPTAIGVVAAVVALALLVPSIADLPARRAAADRSADTGAARWLDTVVPQLQPGAVVVSWWSTSTALWYAKFVEGRLDGIDVVDDRTMLDLDLGGATDVIDRYLGTRPVYVIRANDYDLGLVTQRFTLQPVAGAGSNAVYLVTGRVGA